MKHLIFFVMFILVLGACSDDNVPNTPNYPPNTFAVVDGDIKLNFKGHGTVYSHTDDKKELIISAFCEDSTKQVYWLGINVFFTDKIEKTGTFNFNSKDPNDGKDYAVGYIQYTKDGKKRIYFSYTGSVTLSKISGTSVTGKFDFMGKEEGTGATIDLQNGDLLIED